MSPRRCRGTYPNGVHVAEVEIDPDTGDADVVKYTAVNDFGTVINPMLVEGQIQGGVVQGLGQVLLEGAVYDADGQLVTGSFMDYAMPRAHDAPMIAVVNSSGPDQDQSGRRQRLRRSRLLRRTADGCQRRDRRAVRVRHPPPGDADDALTHLAGHPGRPTQANLISCAIFQWQRCGEDRVSSPADRQRIADFYAVIQIEFDERIPRTSDLF